MANATAPISRPSTVTLNATRRLSLSSSVSPLASPSSAGDSGISVPIRPSAGPARTSRRVRSSRLSERKSKSARPLARRSPAPARPHCSVMKAGARLDRGVLQARVVAPATPQELDDERAELDQADREGQQGEDQHGHAER